MPPRLAYKKSRRGCSKCKARKVKCDEVLPTCGNCRRHGADCAYPPLHLAATRQNVLRQEKHLTEAPCEGQDAVSERASASALSPGRVSKSTPQFSAVDDDQRETKERRLLELGLLMHYITAVVRTLHAEDVDQGVKDAWTLTVPRLSLKHPFLLNSMMAIAALHFAQTSSGRSPSAVSDSTVDDGRSTLGQFEVHEIRKAHQHYLNLAVQGQREAIGQLTHGNADAAFLSTGLLMNQYFLFTGAGAGVDACADTYTVPLQWLKLGAAVVPVIDAVKSLVSADSATETIIRGAIYMYPHNTYRRDANREPFSTLLDWERHPEPGLTAEIQQAYEQTLNYVGGVYIAIKAQESPSRLARRFLNMPSLIPPLYTNLLELKRPRAMVILAHHFAMTKEVDHIWWMRGVAQRHVYGIREMVPEEWQWAMAWPLAIMSAQVPLRPAYGGEFPSLAPVSDEAGPISRNRVL